VSPGSNLGMQPQLVGTAATRLAGFTDRIGELSDRAQGLSIQAESAHYWPQPGGSSVSAGSLAQAEHAAQQLSAAHADALTLVARLRGERTAQEEASGNSYTFALVGGAGRSDPDADTDDMTPEEVREWWLGLTESERDDLIEEDPQRIGNLDGIPFGDRAEANRVNIQNEIDRLESEYQAALDAAVGRGARQVYLNWAERRDLMEYYQSLLDDDRDIVVFDPANDAIAEYLGPDFDANGDIPDTVQHVGTYVPGMLSTVAGFDGTAGTAEMLRNGRPDVAMFAWQGGEFPQDVVAGLGSDHAESLGAALAAFDAGLDTQYDGDSTYVGYSYGGAVVGNAELNGLSADKIVQASSAGVGAGVDSLDDYPNAGEYHFWLLAPADPVILGSELLGGNGASPGEIDGFVQLATGDHNGDVWGGVEVGHWSMWSEQSDYVAQVRTVITGGTITVIP
jgi:hypothetical protein